MSRTRGELAAFRKRQANIERSHRPYTVYRGNRPSYVKRVKVQPEMRWQDVAWVVFGTAVLYLLYVTMAIAA